MSITYTQFAVARFIMGFSSAGCMLCFFVILMEVIGPDYRAMMGIASMGFFAAGVMLLSILAYLVPNW